MSKILTVTFDGSVLRPNIPPDLEPNKRYVISIVSEDISSSQIKATDVWDVLEDLTGTVEAPEDWASQHDHYLYGTPKRHPEINT
ncbi:hypothetical protein FD723_28505 [Nostoc sp. C052]|uniref:hypothetical protein n=1 Tax=Nostoc sp. C052 TaxID=2576902 RepID=UPI0015C2CF6E|nr:hypothetical protein [Nostoc sp. C052]QLE43989.1 hypothetical protein FD723_28505 [Nostoc sp. C052]